MPAAFHLWTLTFPHGGNLKLRIYLFISGRFGTTADIVNQPQYADTFLELTFTIGGRCEESGLLYSHNY
jgi:hypothetical protein